MIINRDVCEVNINDGCKVYIVILKIVGYEVNGILNYIEVILFWCSFW